jgi:uncharacterized protein (DUF2147 family)
MPARRALFLLALVLLSPVAAFAQAPSAPSPVGLWQTVDDHTGKARGLVRIFESQGRLYGDVVRVLDPDKAGAVCVSCTDDRKNKPVQGLQIIRGLQPDGDGWSGGTILDPETGAIYRCSIHLADGGRRLIVRGYVGISLIGRSQTWFRQG